jgi:NADP-dependent 3-hydroxy acid dehydrogenase YdfG
MKQKNIIITGASSGIGEASARVLASRGHRLLLVARSEDKLKALCGELGDYTSFLVADVCDYQQMVKMAEHALQHLGSIDVLVNNAGLGVFDPVAQGKIDDWHKMVDVNIKGLLNALHACLPHLIAAKGQLINLGSIASYQVYQNSGIYCATKHAVLAVSQSLQLELASAIRVTTISPGSTNTPFIDKTTNEQLLKDYKSYFASGMSASLIGEQIAYAIEFPDNAVISEIMIRPSRHMK